MDDATKQRLAAGLRTLAVVAGLVLAFGWGLWTGAPEEDAAASVDDEVGQLWTCSMHPQIQLPEPGDCPICGMDLIPVGEASGPKTRITISERAKALARIQTTPVHRAREEGELRLLGRLDYDETSIRTISPWTGGRIERLFVSHEGAAVRKGQAVAAVFSPEAFAAQQELVSARRQLERLKDALPVSRRAAKLAVEAAETRVQLLGLDPRGVKKASRYITVVSRHRGTVVEILAREGMAIEASQPIFRIADLSTLWAQLDAYEGDIPLIEVGAPVTLEIASFPEERFEGKVAFVDPVVSPTTRTAQVRVEVDNPDGRLRAGMFADAILETKTAQQAPLVIPDSAPLFTGKRSLVYVEIRGADEPTYDAREVQLGPQIGHHFPVVAGLEEGERVVTHGAFVLDSDLQIRGGRSMMTMKDDAERRATEALAVDEAFLRGLAPVFEAYLTLRASLAADDHPAAREAYAALVTAVEGFEPEGPPAARDAWRDLRKPLRSAAGEGGQSADLDAARRTFERVSASVLTALQTFGNPMEDDLQVATCPMAIDGRAAQWVQRGTTVDNPYMGSRMLRCGAIDRHVEPAEAGAHGDGSSSHEDHAAHEGKP